MSSKPVFVLQRTHKETRATEVVLARETLRELQVKYPEYRWEQLKMFALIQDARATYPNALALFKKLSSGHTEASKKKISEAKKGKGNPNYWGIPEERRLRIQATMRAKDNRQIRHPMYGKTRSAATRAALSRAAKRRRYKWAMEPPGYAHRVALDFVLPVGWRWGHGGFRYRRKSRQW